MPNKIVQGAAVVNPDLLGRRAISSDEYVAQIVNQQKAFRTAKGRSTATPAEKRARLASILADKSNAMIRLGQGMIGPIQLRLRYQGMTRNVLLEDPLTPGVPVQYDVLDEYGQAYILSGNEGQVKVTPFEGKKVPLRLFRIATYPNIKKEDLWYLRVNIVEYAQDMSKQAIQMQEDARLLTVLEAAIDNYALDPNHVVSPSHIVNELSGYVTPDSLYDLVALIEVHQLDAARLLFNPIDYRDLNKWDINQTGWAFKDRVVAGEKIVEFGGFQIQRSIQVPQGTIYLTPAPEFLGVFPVMYSLDVVENPTPIDFKMGWVLDELVGMVVLNPRGAGKILKN